MKEKRIKIKIEGSVQGVGMRPFVFRIARKLNLKGFVQNNPEGVLIEVQGKENKLKEFLKILKEQKPTLVNYSKIETEEISLKKEKDFKIIKSEEKGRKITFILPDIATCKECVREIFNKKNRRYNYPFTNCTNCGPRFSIIQNIPYDRKNTTMKIFKMCKDCEREYHNPLDRRFHAQPNACPVCGPYVILKDMEGRIVSEREKAIEMAAKALEQGKILALKGIGGFQLLVRADSDERVIELRKRKKRDEKPFAIMFKTLKQIEKYAFLRNIEKEIILSPASPIVLVKKKKNTKLSEECAPLNPYIGVMIPYTPLHHLLFKKIKFPCICTSGNLSEEPIVYKDEEAIHRLKGIADFFLLHTRPIERYIDDSVVKVINEKPVIFRRARGYAPLPFIVKKNMKKILALGAHLKNTIAISKENRIILSQHIGDLENQKAFNAFKKVIEDFKKLFDFEPDIIVCDAHPEYLSTKYAEEIKGDKILLKAYHHHAHITSCMLENNIKEKVIGISWDGTGYGKDGKIWGGEFLLCDFKNFERIATFREFGILGGDKAIKEPRRAAIGVLYEIFGDKSFELELAPLISLREGEKKLFKEAYKKELSIFKTTSAGRIFDAVSSLCNIKQKISYEGQSAMMLEWFAETEKKSNIIPYPFDIVEKEILIIDWKPMIIEILEDIKNNKKISYIAFRFHITLAEIIERICKIFNGYKISISGGVFQNKLLTELVYKKLKNRKIYMHSQIPPNDGGISAGQIIIAEHQEV